MKINRAVSHSATNRAVAELAMTLNSQPDDVVLCFAAQHHDPKELNEEFKKNFSHQKVIACRTAGEITPDGYVDNSMTAVVLSVKLFTAVNLCLKNLSCLSVDEIATFVKKTLKQLEEKKSNDFSRSNCFAMLIVDGLSQQEEMVSAGINYGLAGIPLFGGSSADSLNHEDAWIHYDGKMHKDAAVLMIVHTQLPFRVFKTEHFNSTEKAFVTTKVNLKSRLLEEVEGYPAAQWYADTIGVKVENLCPEIISKHPITVRLGGKTYVRSIQRIENNGAMRFYCAIDEGVIIYIGEQGNIVDNLITKLKQIKPEVGEIDLLIGFDCILRNVEAKEKNVMPQISKILMESNAIGFTTFGEQHNGLHINQTFTGLAIGQS